MKNLERNKEYVVPCTLGEFTILLFDFPMAHVCVYTLALTAWRGLLKIPRSYDPAVRCAAIPLRAASRRLSPLHAALRPGDATHPMPFYPLDLPPGAPFSPFHAAVVERRGFFFSPVPQSFALAYNQVITF